jgi:2-phospho-L-lactate/phosphoenolpyruvate guanylyltransferase
MSDGIVAVVPVKNLSDVKGRLASRLSPAERANFALESLDRVLSAIKACHSIEAALVVSPDERVRARAVDAGVEAIDDSESPSMPWTNNDSHNRALEHARGVAIRRWQPSALLVLAADLPLVTTEDVAGLITLGTSDRCVVIAPDRGGTGTNGLLLRPPDAVPFRFGVNSFRQHAAEAECRGLALDVYRSVGTSHDVDVPCDLEALGR